MEVIQIFSGNAWNWKPRPSFVLYKKPKVEILEDGIAKMVYGKHIHDDDPLTSDVTVIT